MRKLGLFIAIWLILGVVASLMKEPTIIGQALLDIVLGPISFIPGINIDLGTPGGGAGGDVDVEGMANHAAFGVSRGSFGLTA